MIVTARPWKVLQIGRELYVESDAGLDSSRGPFVCDMQLSECAPIFRESVHADAKHIVHCVNNYETLVGALEVAIQHIYNAGAVEGDYDAYVVGVLEKALAKIKPASVR